MWTEIDKSKLRAALRVMKTETYAPSCAGKPEILKLAVDFQVLCRGGEIRMIVPQSGTGYRENRVPALIKAVARARIWFDQVIAAKLRLSNS